MNCIFCKIINKEEDSETVYEDDDFVAFNDISPKAPVHVLIVPKKHVSSVKEVDEDLAGKLIIVAKKIAEDKKLEGYKLLINVGREGGQIIDHLHLHLLGGEKKDLKNIKI